LLLRLEKGGDDVKPFSLPALACVRLISAGMSSLKKGNNPVSGKRKGRKTEP
jgi:hypothetical protein